MNTENNPKKTLENFENESLDGRDVKGGGGPFDFHDPGQEGGETSGGQDYLPHEHPPHPEDEPGYEHDIAPQPWDDPDFIPPHGGPFGPPGPLIPPR